SEIIDEDGYLWARACATDWRHNKDAASWVLTDYIELIVHDFASACNERGGDWHPFAPAGVTPDRDYCCGDNAEDSGVIIGDFLCYYDDYKDLWEWRNAGTYEFEIYTINGIDYASNSKEWFRCGIDVNEGEVRESSIQDPNPALKFLCYKERDDSYFAECCIEGGGENALEITCSNDKDYPEKVRYIGEPTVLLGREQTLNFEYSASDTGYKSIPVNPAVWHGYDNLEFFFRLDNAKDYEVILLEGPEEFTFSLEDYEIRLRQPLTAVSSYGEWMHAVIPVTEMASYKTANISQIVFYTNITKFEFGEKSKINVERIFLSNEDTQYCTDSYTTSWTNDLDEKYVPEPQSHEACESFRAYKWTGNKCCGDDYFTDDDFYKDDIAGCWHGSVVVNNSITSDRDVLFYNGDFYGCNSEFSSLIDYDADACEAYGDYFCDADGWSDEDSGNVPSSLRGIVSSVPEDIPATQPTSCCSETTCWNGTECIGGFYNLSGNIYGCISGEWKPAELKWDWDNKEYDFCPVEQCLYTTNGESICINDADYIQDHYCNNGDWTTRTRMIALALLDVEAISTDFTLYCDHYTKALADYDIPSVEKYLKGDETRGYADKSCFADKDADCVNNFCVLKYTDAGGPKTAFGVSLNKEIDDADYSFLDAIGKERDYCDDLSGTGPYFRCNAKDVWYNTDSNMIIYAKEKIEISGQQTVFGQISEFFTNIFKIIVGWVPTVPAGSAVDLSLIENVIDYNTLYLQKQGGREVTALMEDTADGVLITVVYDNFDSPVCDAVERLARHEPYQQTECNLTDEGYIIYSNAPEIWQELTSKIRIE
ncbi:hypothetical protein KY317_02840, partial [Candidatus Woesearchaeota archaeon]|nr:hypothetical protein [Candidatus Woesearchaeota archaeon]